MITPKLKGLILEAIEIGYMTGQKDYAKGLHGECKRIQDICLEAYQGIDEKLYMPSHQENVANCLGAMCEELYKIRVTLEGSR